MSTEPEPDESKPRARRDSPMLHGEEAFRLLVDAVQDYAIFLLDADGYIVSWNHGAERIKGYRAEEIIGQHFSIFYTPAERAAKRPAYVLAQATKDGRFEDEGWRVRNDGSRFWADVVITALRNGDEPPYGFAKITRDMTERRAAEEQRRVLEAEQRGRAVAEEALLARDRFLSIASHELRTPVSSLQLAVENLLRSSEMGRLDEERLATGLQRIGRAARRLGSLVSELLDVSLLNARATALNAKPTNLVALVAEVVAQFSETADAERIRVKAPAQAWVPADGARLEQVFTNLIDNALKFSTAPAPVDVEIRAHSGEVDISVADRGMGLDEETAERIFEAFGRGRNADEIQGLGLGLYIAQQIVVRHGGRIEGRRRTPGPGTEFTVSLPTEAH